MKQFEDIEVKVKNGVIYARFSSDNQREESIDAQIRAAKEFAEKKGITIVNVYVDKAKSAKTDNRPQFQQMINDSKVGNFSYAIVHKLDRFSRDRFDSANNKRKLKQNGVKVLSVLENLDGSPESIILESMLEGMAEYYSANLAREVMKGMTENALQAKHTGGIPPLGYNVTSEKKYAINDQEAPIVKLIFKRYLEGFTYKDIVDELNKLGYKTKKGTEFSKGGLNKIFSNEKYCGTYVFNQYANKNKNGKRNSTIKKNKDEIIRIEDGMPAIISKEDFEAVQKIMAQNKVARGARKAKVNYLLSGIIRCGECGYAMHGNKRPSGKDGEYISYRCGCKKSKNLCTNSEIRREPLEEYILTELENRLLSDEVIPEIVKQVNAKLVREEKNQEDRLLALQSKLEQTDKEINNIIDAIMTGMNSQSLKDKMSELEAIKANQKIEIVTVSAEVEEEVVTEITEEQVRAMVADMKEYIIKRDLPQCKQLIKDFVEQVVVYRDHVEVKFNMVFFHGCKLIENYRLKIKKIRENVILKIG
jgi:site-specific DNA recombinase